MLFMVECWNELIIFIEKNFIVSKISLLNLRLFFIVFNFWKMLILLVRFFCKIGNRLVIDI